MSRRTVLITGGASGIGEAAAREFIRRRYQVVLLDKSKTMLDRIVERYERHRDSIVPIELDITRDEAVADLFVRWKETFGDLHSVVNNAATIKIVPFAATEASDWDAMMNVNLRAVYLICRHAYPLLRATRGSVINIGSVKGEYAVPGYSIYGVTKAGLSHLTRSLAVEWRRDGIRVNAVCPGTVDTPLLREMLRLEGHSAEAVKRIVAEGLADRTIQTAEQIARFVFSLTRPDASIVTGACIVADEGSSAE